MSTELIRASATPAPDRYQPNLTAVPMGMESDDLASIPFLLEYWGIVKRHKWLVVASTVACIVLATMWTMHMTRTYDAVGRIVINRESAVSASFKDSAPDTDDFDYNVTLETQVRILQSGAMATQVAHNLRQYLPKGDPSAQRPDQATAAETALAENILANLKITVLPRTRIVEMRYRDTDPRRAADVVNTLASTYIEHNVRAKWEAAMQTSDWLSKQLADLQAKVESSQEKLVEYQRANGILGLDEKQNIITQKLDELNKELTEAQADRIRKQAAYQQLLNGGSGSSTQAANGATTLLDRLLGQESDLQVQYAQANTQFGPSHPTVVGLKNQLDQVRASIRAESTREAHRMENDYRASIRREQMLTSALQQQKEEANKLNQSSIEYNLLKREADSNRQLYDGLLQKLKEAGVTAGLRSSNVAVVDHASVPAAPSSPNVPRNISLGLLLGLTLGIGMAIAAESLDSTVKMPEEVPPLSRLPVLGTIPLLDAGTTRTRLLHFSSARRLPSGERRRGGPEDLVSHSKPRSEMAEAFRALRTSILLSSIGGAPKVLLVTSPLPEEGKTTTTVNTAVMLANQGARVLLVDADMRRPSVHNYLNMANTAGLSTLLASADENVAAVHQPEAIPGLYVIPAGPTPPQPAELLGSSRMLQLIEKWRTEYDHVVIDSPPILTVTDAAMLSVNVDAVALIIRSNRTPKAALRRASDLLRQLNARVIGVVVNALNVTEASSYYYSSYSSHYSSSYGYHEEEREQ